MWEHCGVVRSADGLRQGLARLVELTEAACDLDVCPDSEGYDDLARALDLHAALVAAEATLRSALERRESRGAHIREDCPEEDPNLRCRFLASRDAGGRLVLSSRPVPPVPDHLAPWLADRAEIETGERLLE